VLGTCFCWVQAEVKKSIDKTTTLISFVEVRGRYCILLKQLYEDFVLLYSFF